MVLSGFLFQRAALVAVTVLTLLRPPVHGAAATDVAGTMPEDGLPELRKILTTALRQSPQLMAAEFERMASEARREVVDAARLPGVSGSLSYAVNQTAISSNTSSQTRDHGLFYNLGVTQAVFHWRALRNQSDAARLSQLVAQKNFDLAARELGAIVRKAYLALVVEKARLRQGAESLRVASEDVAVLAEKKDRGLVSPALLEGEKLRLGELQLEYDRAAAEFEASRRRFARLVGMGPAPLPEESVADEIPKPVFAPPLATALAATILRDGAKSTLEYEIHDLRVREATLRLQVERVRLYPKIFASAGLSLENSTNVNGNAVNQQGIQRRTVSVFAQWNIFDGFASRGVVRDALANKRLLERRRESEMEGVLQNAQTLERMLPLDARQLDHAEIRHALAVEAGKRTAEEVALGKQPQSDVERTRIGVRQAEATRQAARAQLLGRWTELVALAGADPLSQSPSNRHVPPQK